MFIYPEAAMRVATRFGDGFNTLSADTRKWPRTAGRLKRSFPSTSIMGCELETF